jgi:hypothetical protein
MNKLNFLLFIMLFGIILLLTTGCPVCKDNDCVDVEIGTAALADSSSIWIPFNGIDTVSFVTSSGFSTQFISSGYQSSTHKLLGDSYDSNCGDPMEDCYEYYTLQEKSLKFASESINLTIEYKLRKNIVYNNFYSQDSINTLTDILIVKINNYSWTIPIQSANNTEISCTTEILDTLSLNSTLYNDVYHSYHTYSYGGVEIKGVYLTKNEGLIGFYYTNDEKWYLVP